MPILDTLMKDLGLAKLPEDKKIGLINAMTESVLKRITIEVLTRLSDADQEKLASFEKNPPKPEEVEAFLKSKIPDYANIQERVVREFKEEMKSTMHMLQAA